MYSFRRGSLKSSYCLYCEDRCLITYLRASCSCLTPYLCCIKFSSNSNSFNPFFSLSKMLFRKFISSFLIRISKYLACLTSISLIAISIVVRNWFSSPLRCIVRMDRLVLGKNDCNLASDPYRSCLVFGRKNLKSLVCILRSRLILYYSFFISRPVFRFL